MAPVNQELSVGKITIKVRITAPYTQHKHEQEETLCDGHNPT